MFEYWQKYYRVNGRCKLQELDFLAETTRDWFCFKEDLWNDSYIHNFFNSDNWLKSIFKSKKEAIDYAISAVVTEIEELNEKINELVKLY